MVVSMVFRSVFELAMFVFIVWGIFHEDRLAAFERSAFAALRRRRLRVVKGQYTKKKYVRNWE